MSRIIATVLTTVPAALVLATVPSGRLDAQSAAASAVWETLARAPLPENAEPIISVSRFDLAPAPPVPLQIGAGHTHAGPVFGYIVQGELENQVEPDPPAIYTAGQFFSEAPGHIHRFMRNARTTERATLLTFSAGNKEGGTFSFIKRLVEERLPSMRNQELSLLRLTLPPGSRAEARAHSGPGLAYVLEGKVETTGTTERPQIHGAGDLFREPANDGGITFRNTSGSEPAKLLVYHVSAKQSGADGPVWETLARAPLPEDSEPYISINSLSVSAEPVPEHSHASPVFGYVVQGEIENHVEPDPPAIHKIGGFFYEAPRHLHKTLRSLSATEPAKLIIISAGRTGVPASFIKALEDEPVQLLRYHFGEPAQPVRHQFREPLLTTVNQELTLLRLTLGAGARSEARSGPGFVYVLEGKIETSGATDRPRILGVGDLFHKPADRAELTYTITWFISPAMLLLVQVNESSDWPQFRGLHRNGVATTFSAPRSWPEQLTRKWKVDVGEGYATPILVGNRLYVFTRQGDNEVMQAVDAASGTSLWQTSYPAMVTVRPGARPHGPGPKSTPLFADGRLFTLGMSGVVTAFDAATGKQIWQRPPDPVLPRWNTAASPLIDRGHVILHVGGENQGALTAFDAATGAVRWSWNGDGPSYASPVVAELNGVRQIITLTQDNVVGISATDGQLLWRRPFSTQLQNIIMPVVIRDTIVVAGYQKPTSAFRVIRKGNEWTTEDVWENPEVWQFMTNGVMVGDRLFGLSTRNRGEYFLLDTRSGAKVWTGMPRQAENAAIVRAGDFVISLEDDAELMVGRVSGSQFEELKRYTVADAATWAAPVISGNRIFVKDTSTLALWTVN